MTVNHITDKTENVMMVNHLKVTLIEMIIITYALRAIWIKVIITAWTLKSHLNRKGRYDMNIEESVGPLTWILKAVGIGRIIMTWTFSIKDLLICFSCLEVLLHPVGEDADVPHAGVHCWIGGDNHHVSQSHDYYIQTAQQQISRHPLHKVNTWTDLWIVQVTIRNFPCLDWSRPLLVCWRPIVQEDDNMPTCSPGY